MPTNSHPVLITGGAGFIGSHLAEALVGLGQKVRIFDNLATGRKENLIRVWNRIEFVKGDILEPKALNKALKGVQIVYHLAALTSVLESLAKPALYLEVDGLGTLNVLEGAAKIKAKRVIIASSSAVYGEGPSPQIETQTLSVDSPYAAAKLLSENLGLYFQRSRDLEVISLRLFNVYGPRLSSSLGEAPVIGLFLKAASQGQSPIIYGDGEQTRDFIEVRDVVRAMVLAGQAPLTSGGVFNVGTGQGVSINFLYRLLKELKPSFPPPVHQPARLGDVLQSMASVAKASRFLKFTAHIDLREGLAYLLASPGQENK
ncbi:MAG: GDP-mannose 4,6-dehydratase [Deltaproteobacteria bacterium]|jgi:UDP-glucose 4-epimerase|nr:GDP-mannose 4,6-dehydratase [Deltaproteobacteria bacterium]